VRRFALLALALALAFVAGGCGGDSEKGYEAGQLEDMVVLADDLEGQRWTRFDWGKQVRSDQPAGARSNPDRFGRLDGWKARYRRPGTRQTEGPLVVESRADVFEDKDGARQDYETYGSELERAGLQLEPQSGLGDAGIVATIVDNGVRFYLVQWRHDNSVASINVNGYDGKLTKEHAVELARKQLERMQAA
jgi:hypothetical protein